LSSSLSSFTSSLKLSLFSSDAFVIVGLLPFRKLRVVGVGGIIVRILKVEEEIISVCLVFSALCFSQKGKM